MLWQQIPESLRQSTSASIMMSHWAGDRDVGNEASTSPPAGYQDSQAEQHFRSLQLVVKELRNIRAGTVVCTYCPFCVAIWFCFLCVTLDHGNVVEYNVDVNKSIDVYAKSSSPALQLHLSNVSTSTMLRKLAKVHTAMYLFNWM